MCATTGDNVNVQMNICPSVVFKANGEGVVKNSDLVSEVFQWKLNDERLHVDYPEAKTTVTFSDSIFVVEIIYQKGTYDANIRSINNRQMIYLKKSSE